MPAKPIHARPWPRRHTRAAVAALLLLVLTAGALTLPRTAPAPRPIAVVYEVTGTITEAQVRFSDAAGALSPPTTVTLPWRTRFTVPAQSRFVTMSAQRTAAPPGELTCRITADGVLIALDGLGGGFAQCTGVLRDAA